MERKWIAVASGLMLIAVAFGAFGAHGLKARLTPDELAQWRTGVEYQFIHALGILLLTAFAGRINERALHWASWAFLGGTLLFSGSLYLLSTRDLLGMPGLGAVVGPITPLGGLLFMAGWDVLLITALKQTDRR
jgi:uncharacterized membrane protein YgdD (TMEM256/DUF423 family)